MIPGDGIDNDGDGMIDEDITCKQVAVGTYGEKFLLRH